MRLSHSRLGGRTDADADLQVELGLKSKELRSLRAPLERCGAIVSRSMAVTAGHGHTHTSELARWDQVHPEAAAMDASPQQALADLLVAAVRAAVIAPERELKHWFSWQRYWGNATVDELVRE